MGHFSRATTAKNAAEFVDYLKARTNENIAAPEAYLDGAEARDLYNLREAEAAVGATEIEVSKRLYVGNLPPNTTREELQSAFDTAGLSIRDFIIAPRLSGGTTRWFSIVEMSDGKSAIAAIDSPILLLGGRRLIVNEAHPLSDQITRRRGKAPKADITERLYIAGLSSSTNEMAIRSLFHKYGLQPIDVFLPKHHRTKGGQRFRFRHGEFSVRGRSGDWCAQRRYVGGQDSDGSSSSTTCSSARRSGIAGRKIPESCPARSYFLRRHRRRRVGKRTGIL